MGNGCLKEPQSEVLLTQDGKFTLPLTDHEISLLRESWAVIKPNWCKIMCCVYNRLFKQYPELRLIFNFIEEPALQNTIASQSLQRHAERFSTFIHDIFDEFKSKNDISESIVGIGKGHHRFGAQQKYVTALGMYLKLEVCVCLRQDGPGFSTCQIENAWDSLFKYLTGLLKFGMRKGIEEEKNRADEVIFKLQVSNTNVK